MHTNGSDSVMISNSDRNILPYQVLYVIGVDNEPAALSILDNHFIRNNVILDENDLKYNFLYFNYIQSISSNYYYLLSNKYYINEKLNYDLVFDLYNEIKQLQLTDIYKDSTITNYTFSYAKDILTIDPVNYENLKDTILSNVDITKSYDTDNTDVAEYEDVMSVLIGEDIYKINATDTTGAVLVAFFKYNDIMDTDNKFIIFNKVIGID
jgi:hypothetical protein